MEENVACVKINVAAAEKPGDTIQCRPDVKFVSVGIHLLDGERDVGPAAVIAQWLLHTLLKI